MQRVQIVEDEGSFVESRLTWQAEALDPPHSEAQSVHWVRAGSFEDVFDAIIEWLDVAAYFNE